MVNGNSSDKKTRTASDGKTKDAPKDSTGLSQPGPSTSVRRQSAIVSSKSKMKAEASVSPGEPMKRSQLPLNYRAISPLARASPGFDASLAMLPATRPKFGKSRSVSISHEKPKISCQHSTKQSKTPRLICGEENCKFRTHTFDVMRVHTLWKHSAKPALKEKSEQQSESD